MFVLSLFLNTNITSELYQCCGIFPSSIILLDRILKLFYFSAANFQHFYCDPGFSFLLFFSWFSANLISELVISSISSEPVLSIVLSIRRCCVSSTAWCRILLWLCLFSFYLGRSCFSRFLFLLFFSTS